MAKQKLPKMTVHMVEVLAWAGGVGGRELICHSEEMMLAKKHGLIRWSKSKHQTVLTAAGMKALREAAGIPRRRRKH